MKLTNSLLGYGWISIALHWTIAVTIFGLFILGLWMVGLSFYSPWYHDAPAIHKSLGVLLVGLMALRLVWRWSNPTPQPPKNHSQLTTITAHSAHALLYLLVFALGISGYFISTAEGHGIEVFNWFSLPAYPLEIENQADIAGVFHYWLAIALIGLASVHMLAALKHHFIDKDTTLTRMLKATQD